MSKILANKTSTTVLSWQDLFESEKKKFDYLNTPELQSDAKFIPYRGWIYDLGKFTPCQDYPFWDGHLSESDFHSVLIRYTDSGVLIGLAIS